MSQRRRWALRPEDARQLKAASAAQEPQSKPRPKIRKWHLAIVALAFTGIVTGTTLGIRGCAYRPHAPVLRNEPVFQSSREGLRFNVPDGWIQHTRADIPPGKVDKERLLVAYRQSEDAPIGADLEVSLIDLPPDADLAAYLAAASHGAARWQSAGKPEELSMNGEAALRYVFTASRDRMFKEAVVFRRQERVYFFVGLFAASDKQARQQIRRAIESVTWRH